MSASLYGDGCAEFYDDIYGPPKIVVLRALERLARGGSVLELGIGTGRTALALLKNGVQVAGIEASRAMINQLLAKPEANRLQIVEGDFSSTCLDQQFDLIFSLVNTFFLLESLEKQVVCLSNVAKMLKRDGVFAVECFRPSAIDSAHSAEGIRVTLKHELQTRFGWRAYETNVLYQDIDVLDGLAADAGLVLRERWANWQGGKYDHDNGCHVSLYALR